MSTKVNEPEFSNLRLLLVEDNEAASWGLSIILKKKGGYIVETALTGENALSIAPSFEPDVISMGVN